MVAVNQCLLPSLLKWKSWLTYVEDPEHAGYASALTTGLQGCAQGQSSSTVQVPSSAKLWDANCANQLTAMFFIVTLLPWELLSSITARLYLQTVKRDQDKHGLRQKRHLHFCMRVQSWLILLLDLSEGCQEVKNLEGSFMERRQGCLFSLGKKSD